MIKTNIDKFYLKKATIEDAQIVFDYIKKLALYEKLTHDVSGTLEDLKKNIWQKNLAEVLLAYEDEKPIGFCLYFTTFSTFTCKGNIYLEDIFIDVEYRKKGYGYAIFKALAQIAQERDYERFEWVCLDWNESSIRFYEDKLTAQGMKEWIRFRLDKEGIAKIANE